MATTHIIMACPYSRRDAARRHPVAVGAAYVFCPHYMQGCIWSGTNDGKDTCQQQWNLLRWVIALCGALWSRSRCDVSPSRALTRSKNMLLEHERFRREERDEKIVKRKNLSLPW
jgi:hypothetical protein